MTERARRGSRAVPVYTAVGVSFVVAASGVAVQMARGSDPSLGAGRAAATATVAAAPPVVIRRIEKTVIVTRVLPARSASSGGSAGAPVIRATATGAPAPRASVAPPRAVAAPTPVPAPAPVRAPAPAPVTRSS